MATLTTSSGTVTIYPPLSENITIMVKSSATSVTGEIFLINTLSYHSFDFLLIRMNRVMTPAMNGMPR